MTTLYDCINVQGESNKYKTFLSLSDHRLDDTSPIGKVGGSVFANKFQILHQRVTNVKWSE